MTEAENEANVTEMVPPSDQSLPMAGVETAETGDITIKDSIKTTQISESGDDTKHISHSSESDSPIAAQTSNVFGDVLVNNGSERLETESVSERGDIPLGNASDVGTAENVPLGNASDVETAEVATKPIEIPSLPTPGKEAALLTPSKEGSVSKKQPKLVIVSAASKAEQYRIVCQCGAKNCRKYLF